MHDVAEDLLVPDPGLSIRDGAIAAWPGANRRHVSIALLVTSSGRQPVAPGTAGSPNSAQTRTVSHQLLPE
ncbi:hypothetical protein AB0M36_08285 [Actinoplanes sp. NPDC051346]|uniref:hypothetical protein n=1 Tax=Actinoplanes sp. NPDC051346 TaxID=3155048 RepID=UPI0034430B92